MWPMSHALYPGLKGDPPERPATANSQKTWYGNHRKSYTSTNAPSYQNSVYSHASRGAASQTSVPGENLGDLIHRSRHVLSALNTHDNDEDHKLKLVTTRREEREFPEPNEGESSHHRIASLVPSIGTSTPTTSTPRRGAVSSPSIISAMTLTTLASPVDSPDITLHKLHQIPSVSPIASGSDSDSHHDVGDMGHQQPETSDYPPTELCTPDLTQPKSASHPGSDESDIQVMAEDEVGTSSTAAPSFNMAFEPEFREKRLGSFDINQSQEKDENEEEGEEEDTAGHLSGLPLIAVTIALSAAVFLVAMDVNVIATAIPRITGEFRSLDDIGWYGSAFLMATCATQIPYGRVYTLFPAKWVFVSAIFIFMLGSLIAAVAPNSPLFIFGRAVQGVGTSGILSGGLIIMSQVVALRLRPMLTGVIGAMEGVAMISAPIIGGVLTDRLNWRWCFYINLPIGGFVLLVVLVCLRIPKQKAPRRLAGTTWLQTLRELDVLGAVTLLPPIVCTLLALHFAGNGYSWSDSSVILLFVLAFVLFGMFAYTQQINADVAMIPFRIVKQRCVMAGFWYILCTSSALVVITYFLPLWFQSVKDTSAQQSGVGLIPMLIAVIIGVVASGALVSLLGYYTPFALAGSVLMPIGIGLLSTITPDTSRAALIAYPAIFGLGVGIGFQQPLIGVQAVLPQADIAVGTSIIVFGQTIGAAIIIAVGENVFQNRLVTNMEERLGLANVNTEQLLGDGPASLTALLTEDELPKLLYAVSASLTETFYLALAMAALSIVGSAFMGWTSVKQPKGEKKDGRVGSESA